MAEEINLEKIFLDEIIIFVQNDEESDIDSSNGGLSKDEKEAIDAALLGYDTDVEQRYIYYSSFPDLLEREY